VLLTAELAALVKDVHENICSYGHATVGSVPVRFEIFRA
jgi:hypothetical protein